MQSNHETCNFNSWAINHFPQPDKTGFSMCSCTELPRDNLLCYIFDNTFSYYVGKITSLHGKNGHMNRYNLLQHNLKETARHSCSHASNGGFFNLIFPHNLIVIFQHNYIAISFKNYKYIMPMDRSLVGF